MLKEPKHVVPRITLYIPARTSFKKCNVLSVSFFHKGLYKNVKVDAVKMEIIYILKIAIIKKLNKIPYKSNVHQVNPNKLHLLLETSL